VPVSVCTAVYRVHRPPNVATLGAALRAALGDEPGELVVALNGVSATAADVPAGARTVDLGVNRGVAPGWNAAAAAAIGDVLAFANDDVELGSGSLARLARVLGERPEAGVVGPVGTRWDIPAGVHREWIDTSALPPGEIAACEVVSGFLLVCRREVYEAIGGFDERYAPCSWEEVDFCTAARVRGFSCYAVAGVDVAHEWGISARQPPWRRIRYDGRSESLWRIHRRNRRYFQAKWAGREPEAVSR
jgi:GT2 family glycosyltransferase